MSRKGLVTAGALAAVTVGLVVALVAQPAAAGETPTDPKEQGRLFAQCMREHGVSDFPDPNPNGPTQFGFSGGADEQKKFQEAQKACEQFAPGEGGQPGEVDQAQLEKFRQFSQCMRDHGVAGFPDPEPEGGGIRVSLGDGDGLDPNSSTFKSAQDACQSLVPPPPDGGGGMQVHSEGGPGGGA